jgi:hypothetical protein
MRVAARCAVAALIAALAGPAAADDVAATLAERWRSLAADLVDPQDGKFDASRFLERAAGFLPVPVVVTEPAVGYGGGLVALFVRPRREAGGEGYARPDLSAAGFVRTQNGTHLALAGDVSRWMEGRLRTLVGVAGGAINLDVYGLGATPGDAERAVRYTFDIRAAGAQVDWQVAPSSPWSVGGRFVYADVRPKLRDAPVFPGLEDRTRVKIAGPGVALIHDTRDTIFTPTRGTYAEAGLVVSDAAFGADVDFRRFNALAMGWWPVAPNVTLGARADYLQASDGAPFYVRPFILMRGIPVMRYPGNRVVQAELEARWQFAGRWSVVGFGGAGLARLDEGPAARDRTAGAGGVGIRYELARKFGLHAGLDVARGPEETAVYLQVGSAWARP